MDKTENEIAQKGHYILSAALVKLCGVSERDLAWNYGIPEETIKEEVQQGMEALLEIARTIRSYPEES